MIILLPFLLLFAGLLVFFAVTRRWIQFTILLGIPLTIAVLFFVQSLTGTTRLYQHTFESGGTVQIIHTKPYGLKESIHGIGDLTYTYEKGIFKRNGILTNHVPIPYSVQISNTPLDSIIVNRTWQINDDGSLDVINQ